MTQFYEGQIFEEMWPQEAADFCNESQSTENRFHIAEIESIEKEVANENDEIELKTIRRFQIVRNPDPTPLEQAQLRIDELQKYLTDTDWYVNRFTETGKPIPQEILDERQSARDEISALRQKYAL